MNFTTITQKQLHWINIGFYIYCCVLCVEFILQFTTNTASPDFLKNGFLKFALSDWLINYQDGFIRRGLIGEFLLFLYNQFHLNVGYVIYFICYFSFFGLIAITIFLFRKKGLSYTLLPLVFMLGRFGMNPLIWYRRDALMLLIIYLSFYFYHRIISATNKALYTLLFYTAGITVILIHEASFFCFVPFTFLHFLFHQKKFNHKFISALTFVSPLVIAMSLVCIYKGDVQSATNIWQSWQPYFYDTFNESLPMGSGVKALAWNSLDTFQFHFYSNYLAPFLFAIPRLCIWTIIYFVVFNDYPQ